MRGHLPRIVGLAAFLVSSMLTSRANAQLLLRSADGRLLRVVYVPVPGFSSIQIRTTVAVPDGGSVNLGGASQVSGGRNEFGTPGLGKLPYLGRGFRNAASGRQTTSTRLNVRVRIIDLREEEYRQTGVRSR